MDSIAEKSVVLSVPQALLSAGARIVVLGTTLVGTGCIVPVPSVSPVYTTGIFDEATMESLTGLDREEVNGRIGRPDYSGLRGDSYVMVYQGEKHYSTDVYIVFAAGGNAGGAKIDTGGTKGLYCYVIELDEDHIVKGYDVIVRMPGGITTRDSSDYAVDPIADCSEAVWKPDERKEVLTKTADLEARVEHGDTEAAIELAELTGNLAPLEERATEGNPAAAYAYYEHLSRERQTFAEAWRWLCKAASNGYGNAQAEVGRRHNPKLWFFTRQAQWLQDEVGIQPDNRIAYMWYTLADSNGGSAADGARDQVVPDMTADEITQAEQMVRNWKPGDCPSAEHRLGVRGGARNRDPAKEDWLNPAKENQVGKGQDLKAT